MPDTDRPLILYALPPREGHIRPALQICSHLVSRGFDVTLLGTPRWKHAIEAAGASYAPVIGLWATLDDLFSPKSRWRHVLAAPSPAEQRRLLTADLSHKVLAGGLESVRHALAEMRHRHQLLSSSSGTTAAATTAWLRGTKTVVILSDTCFSGTLPLKLGADMPPGYEGVTIRTVGIGVVPQFWAAPARPPWGLGLPHDPSEEGVQRNLREYAKEWDQQAEERARWVLESLNCDETVDMLFAKHDKQEVDVGFRHPFHDSYTVCHDTTLQLSIPSLEFPARVPSHLRFAGSLPAKPLSLWQHVHYPAWFEEHVVQAREAQRRVVLVAQGTESPDHRELILPTIRALAAREDLSVVAVLCREGASLSTTASDEKESDDEFTLPPNAHVVGYFPYDAVLQHAHLFISGSGYGGLTHAVANGVPLIQAGDKLDKADIGRRVEYSGLGLYVGGSDPGEGRLMDPEVITAAVDKVFGDFGRFKKRALEMRDEAMGYQPLEILEREIMALV